MAVSGLINSVVQVFRPSLKRDRVSGAVGEDDEIAGTVGNHSRRDAACHRLNDTAPSERWCWPRIALRTALHGFKDAFEIGYAN